MPTAMGEPGTPPGADPVAHAAVGAGPRVAPRTSVLARTLRNLTVQDWVMVAFHAYLMLRALTAPEGPRLAIARSGALSLCCVIAGTLALTRGCVLPAGPTRALVYRIGMFGSMAGSYFTLGPLLWSLGPTRYDPQLIAIDEALFGVTPSAFLDQFVTPATVEWFAFFYYSYYTMIGLYLLPTLFFDSGRRRYELLFGAGMIVAFGHTGYTLVPGVGPYAWPTLSFTHELVAGIWWQRVHTAVASAGAMLDIFPSLHTALSVLIVLHAVRYRKDMPFRWVWLPTIFIVVNIVIATVFLRWHYGIDLVAGAFLTCSAYAVGTRLWGIEGKRGDDAADDRQVVWEPVVWSRLDARSFAWLVAITLLQATVIVSAAVAASP